MAAVGIFLVMSLPSLITKTSDALQGDGAAYDATIVAWMIGFTVARKFLTSPDDPA